MKTQDSLTLINSTEFLTHLKSKKPEAIELVVREYTKVLYKVALSAGLSSHDADDIIQSTWMTFFDVIQKFEAKSQVKTFIIGILYNKISEWRKKNNKIDHNVEIETILDENFDENGHWVTTPKSPFDFIHHSQLRNFIRHCLSLLPEKQQTAFHLKEVENTNTDEICNILNINVTHLGVLLFRARNQMRVCLEKKI